MFTSIEKYYSYFKRVHVMRFIFNGKIINENNDRITIIGKTLQDFGMILDSSYKQSQTQIYINF